MIMDELNEIKAAYEHRIKELERDAAELRDFIENAAIPLHWVDGDGIIIWANQSELDMLGFSKEEYIGHPISSFHADDDIIGDILSRLGQDETLLDYPARLKCKDGSVKHVLINSNVLRKDGEFVHTRCFTRDITERKEEEQRKNDFVAMVSHELKTPLTSITSYIQMVLSKLRKENHEFGVNVLARADVQTRKMAVMIHDFLSLARLEERKIQITKEDFKLHDLMEEIAGDTQFISSKHKVQLLDCEQIMVHADRDKIGQVLMNLLSNAIKYSPAGGDIIIGCEKQGDSVKIFVKDQGVGISTADQQRLFERFYRVNNDKVKSIPGFGIGLYLIAEILRYHNSKIQVESEVDKGSTFYFTMDILS